MKATAGADRREEVGAGERLAVLGGRPARQLREHPLDALGLQRPAQPLRPELAVESFRSQLLAEPFRPQFFRRTVRLSLCPQGLRRVGHRRYSFPVVAVAGGTQEYDTSRVTPATSPRGTDGKRGVFPL